MRYVANPVEVDAYEIADVGELNSDGSRDIVLSTGVIEPADKGMLARYTPQPGDYWVKQADGYVYVNPKAVFERKYRPVKEG